MRKMLCLCLMSLVFICFCRAAIILDDGLILQDGSKRIEMKVGQRVYLKVQHSVWKYPVLKNLEFSSKNPLVAYADTYGWIHAQAVGRTVISVWNDQGANGTIEVIVRGKEMVSPWIILAIFALFLISGGLFLMPKKFVVLNEFFYEILCRLNKYFRF